jgi:Zn-dependent M28 family amino/carboxypeptidase
VAVRYDENIKKYSLINVIDSLFSAKPETIQINYSNELRLHTTQNVCAMISGSEVPDSIIIFSAHYDHVGTLGSKTYYPGAHDNASGTAAVMDIARYFSANPPKYSVAFLLFTAEEAGLLGSSYFVMNPLFSLKKVKMAINLDMFCGGDDGLMVVNSQAKETKPFFDRMKELNEVNRYVKELKSRPNAPNSDHYFLSMHCPAIFIYTLGGRYGGYHNVYDTCEECGLENYQNIINLIIQSVAD